MSELQPIAFACRQKIGVAKAEPSPPPSPAPLSSSVPSSAGKTPPSIQSTFQGSAASLPTGQLIQELDVSPSGAHFLLPTGPRKAALIGDIKEKLNRTN